MSNTDDWTYRYIGVYSHTAFTMLLMIVPIFCLDFTFHRYMYRVYIYLLLLQ